MPEKPNPIPHSTHDASTYNPTDVLNRVLRRWWLLAILTIAGGLLGLVVNTLRPQPYEAGFRLLTAIEVSNSGELTQYQEDITYEAVGALLLSPTLKEAVIHQAGLEGIILQADYLNRNAVGERRLATWQVRVRHSDAQSAEMIASIWLRLADAEIKRAYAEAIEADGLERYLESMEKCLARASVTSPTYGLCSQGNLDQVQAEIHNTGKQLAEARLSSRGLSSSLSIDQAEADLIPAHAVSDQRGQQVMAGALVGFIIGLWALQVNFHGTARG
jgi:hypothetical protein